MIEIASIPPVAQGTLVVGIILVEAVVLYFGYGAIEQIVEEPLRNTMNDG